MRASTSDIYGVLGSILVEQKKGQHPLKFSIDRETLHCLSTDQEKAMKELTAVNSSTVDSLPPPKPAHSKKTGRRNRRRLPLQTEKNLTSPLIFLVMLHRDCQQLHTVVPDSKLLIYTENVSSRKFSANLPSPPSAPDHFSPSLQSPGPAPLETDPLRVPSRTHHLSQKQTMSMVRLTPSSPQAAKRKDRLDDSNSSSPPLPKKRKKISQHRP
jgi:hypothetical protein